MPNIVQKLGYEFVLSRFSGIAGKRFNPKNPYVDEDGSRIRLPENATKEEQKFWRQVQRQAWRHDKCFLGSCGVGMDCGLGLAPLVVLLPVIGPYLMYLVHSRSIKFMQKNHNLPTKMIAQMHSNIFIDLLISIPPVLGFFLAWLNGCSTRNAALAYKYLVVLVAERANGEPVFNSEVMRDEKKAYPSKRTPQQTFLDNWRKPVKSKEEKSKVQPTE